jgi:hypothetical protein
MVAMSTHPDLIISCDSCVMRATRACDDCLVTFIAEREPDDAVVIDVDVLRSMRMLSAAGLLPELRHATERHPAARRAAR